MNIRNHTTKVEGGMNEVSAQEGALGGAPQGGFVRSRRCAREQWRGAELQQGHAHGER